MKKVFSVLMVVLVMGGCAYDNGKNLGKPIFIEKNSIDLSTGVLGAVVGGLAGKSLGGGKGKDIATVVGAVVGGVVGLSSNRDRVIYSNQVRGVSTTRAKGRNLLGDRVR